jgi:signal transduction histidine kinase/CheY-like chemotaxis protein
MSADAILQDNRTMRIDIAPSEIDTHTTQTKSTKVRFRRSWRLHATERSTSFFKLLESVYDAVLITDLEGKILECNQRASEFFLQPSHNLVEQSIVRLISGATPSLITTIQTNLADQKYTLVDAYCKRSDNTSFPAEIAINKVELDAHGQLCFFIRDMTVRHNAICALQDANERLQAHDRARLEFVSNVSHELRTPLTSMVYAVNNMIRGVVGAMPEKAMQYLERLQADCQRLLATINDILDVSQIENKSLVLTKQVVPISTFIHDGLNPVQIQADAKHIDIRLNIQPPELFCHCDAQKMERVVLNIVGNAIKFTPEKGIISISLNRSLIKTNTALLSVCDTGMGVSPEMLPKLAQRFVRAGDHVAGTGLGLAISREIIDLHGGGITFESPVKGTTCGTAVYVELPLAQAPLVMALSQDTAITVFLTEHIQKLGYGLTFFEQSSLLRDTCFEHPPTLLMLDSRITDMDIRELVMQLRENPKTKRLPIIAFANVVLARADVELYRHQGIFYFCLPWNETELAKALSMAVRGKLR